MKTYSLSLLAHKPADPLGQGWLIGHAATFCYAEDQAGALKIGAQVAKALWPAAAEWIGHDVQIAVQPNLSISTSALLIGIPHASTIWVSSDEDDDDDDDEAESEDPK